jgi:hypothetical protein
MAALVERLLELADSMAATEPSSSTAERRAVSTAYYAAFHGLARVCTATLLADDVEIEAYERVYRALDHGSLKTAFQTTDSPLKRNANLKRIGDLIVSLQSARMLADYAPPRTEFCEAGAAQDHVGQARQIIAQLDALPLADRQTLAAYLLFPSRKK